MALRLDLVPMHLILSQLFFEPESLRRSEGGSFMFIIATSTSPSLSKSPKAVPRLGRGSVTAGPAVAVVVAHPNPHSSLWHAIFIQGAASLGADFLECPIMIVAVEAAWHRVTRNIDIGPTVVVKIRCAHAKAVRARGNPLFTRESGRRRAARNRNTGSLGNILKRSIAVIVVQNVCSTTESLRSTADKQAKILAVLIVAG